MAFGGVAAGMTLYLEKGVPAFDDNYFEDHTVVKGDRPIPAGETSIDLDFAYADRRPFSRRRTWSSRYACHPLAMAGVPAAGSRCMSTRQLDRTSFSGDPDLVVGSLARSRDGAFASPPVRVPPFAGHRASERVPEQ